MASKKLAVFATKPFYRFARKARLTDGDLWNAAESANSGQMDADLGGGVVKQRIAREGQGKSGGSRAIILLRRGDRAVFVYGFEKKDRANIDLSDLDLFRELAPLYLDAPEGQLAEWVKAGAMSRIACEAGEE